MVDLLVGQHKIEVVDLSKKLGLFQLSSILLYVVIWKWYDRNVFSQKYNFAMFYKYSCDKKCANQSFLLDLIDVQTQ